MGSMKHVLDGSRSHTRIGRRDGRQGGDAAKLLWTLVPIFERKRRGAIEKCDGVKPVDDAQATPCAAGTDCLLTREMEISVVGSRAARRRSRDVDLSRSPSARWRDQRRPVPQWRAPADNDGPPPTTNNNSPWRLTRPNAATIVRRINLSERRQ